MNLAEFMASDLRNHHVEEPGLQYYVRKSWFFPGLIELATCVARPESGNHGYWRFLKKYESSVPFVAEQVINAGLVALLERRGWRKWNSWGTPQLASPLAELTFGDLEDYQKYTKDKDFAL